MQSDARRSPMAVMIAFLLVSSTCSSSKDLTRDKAHELIDSHQSLQLSEVEIALDAYRQALHDGYFLREGKEVAGLAAEDFTHYWWLPYRATLRQPLKCSVTDVSGITDAPGGAGKLVEFACVFHDVPERIARYTGTISPQAGRAILKLYDDGWRVQEIELKPQPVSPAALEQSAPLSSQTRKGPLPKVIQPKWAVVSLGSYSDGDGYYQLELWRDDSSNGQVLGRIATFPHDVSQNPSVGQLSITIGNGVGGPFRFTSRLSGETVVFTGTAHGTRVEGTLGSTADPQEQRRQIVFSRLDEGSGTNYETRGAWEERNNELLACCGPDAKSSDSGPS